MIHPHDLIPNFAVTGGSTVAVVGGVVTHLLAVGDLNASGAGLVVALAGLITAAGGVLIPALKIVSANQQAREKDRWERHEASEKAKWERHDIANQLNIAKLKIEEQQQLLEYNQRTIDALLHHRPIDQGIKPAEPPGDQV